MRTLVRATTVIFFIVGTVQARAEKPATKQNAVDCQVDQIVAELALDGPAMNRLRAITSQHTAAMEDVERDDRDEKEELQRLVAAQRSEEPRATALVGRILENESRVAALRLDWARDVRRLLLPQQFARLVAAWSTLVGRCQHPQ